MNPDAFFPFTLTRKLQDIRVGIFLLKDKWERVSSAGQINHATDIARMNGSEIRIDFQIIRSQRKGIPIPVSNHCINAESIFIEEGAIVENAFLNASEGPVYIGKNACIMEGSMIRGPFAACEGAIVKMGSKIYGGTSIGPYCTVGGEIKNSVLLEYSNKAHDGYLGDSVIGACCNLGAGTSNSNIKNSAAPVSMWNDAKKEMFPAAQKAGVLMGDYSRTAINSSINTGTVIGVCCNVFGKGLTPSYLPSFSWGYDPVEKYRFEKAIEHITNWKKLKNSLLSENEISILKNIFDQQNKLQ